jgi:hypothetical protein
MLNLHCAANSRMQIFNIASVCIFDREVSAGISQFDVSSLPEGWYIMQLEVKNGTFQKKLLKLN